MLAMAGSRQSLTKGLERKVLAIVRRYINEHSITEEDHDSLHLSVSQVYKYVIKDRSMARQRERNLEKMIEGALATIRDEEAEADSLARELVEVEEPKEGSMTEPKESNTINQQVTDRTIPASPPSRKRMKRQLVKDGESIKRQKQNNTREPPKDISLKDIGGREEVIKVLLRKVVRPLLLPEISLHTGVQPVCGVLLHGPPGCGKTMLANAIAREVGLPFIPISAPSIVSGMSGESEKILRELFEKAKAKAPCLIFIDEIDAITQKRDNAKQGMEGRIVAQMLTCMDDVTRENTGGRHVMIIGATNRPDSLDAALRRPGRFDIEIYLGVPDEVGREKILRKQLEGVRLSGDFDFKKLAKATAGFVGADLRALAREASTVAEIRTYEIPQNPPAITDPSVGITVNRLGNPASMDIGQVSINSIQRFHQENRHGLTREQLDPLYITFPDFLVALKEIQPSTKREGFATVPDVTWADVGALESIKSKLHRAIVRRIKDPEGCARAGLPPASGVLLWGPPGCGKTLLAKAAANESGANFMGIGASELLNKYVGESEKAVSQVFSRARACIPCVIFFDEFDALAPRRNDNFSESTSRVVNTLLTELDGLNDCKGIHIIATTNRRDMIDPAMLRPGRLGRHLFVNLPNAEGRLEILKTLTKKTPLSNVDLKAVAEDSRCQGFSGADLMELVTLAKELALEQSPITEVGEVGEGKSASDQRVVVTREHLEKAFAEQLETEFGPQWQ